jgi:hypothetical protein
VNAPLRIFALHAHEYAEVGLAAIPVDTRRKKPTVKGWQRATPRLALNWAKNQRLGSADGLGIIMGKPSGITEIDVDGVGDAWMSLAIERFGETPILIRTASGKSKLWYRHDGEGRHIRPFVGQPIDILGSGFTIAPPSYREDLATSYIFLAGGLNDLERLPRIQPQAFERAAESVKQGQRNESLWYYCMTQARHCDDVAALVDVAATWAQAFPDPLPTSEVERCALSAWKYEANGRNFLGLRKPQITAGDKIMDDLLDHPEAYTLLQMFLRWHGNRQSFAIAPTAMSEAGSPPWPRRRIERARDILLQRGFIEELAAPIRGKKSGQYRLSAQIGRFAKDHSTPFSPVVIDGLVA